MMLTAVTNPSILLLKQKLNLCVHKNSYVNVYSGFLLLENINSPTDPQTNKQINAQLWYGINKSKSCMLRREYRLKSHIVYNSVFAKKRT